MPILQRPLQTVSHLNTKTLGVDAGGTFTDFVLIEGSTWRIHKVLSTPDNPEEAILQGISELGLSEDVKKGKLRIIHGSTVATNAALENKGVRTAYITNRGFKDVLTIGRQARKELYNLNPKPPEPPVPSQLCLEVDCRRDANGKIITSLSDSELDRLRHQVSQLKPKAIAINLLFSFLDESEEIRIQTALENDYFVSRSSFVLPKYKEYERGMATWLNASLGPKVSAYILKLENNLSNCPISIMQSSGGTISIDQAAKRAVSLLLSGPAGGLSAVRAIGDQCQQDKIISFDMGGTSTDVALMDGDFVLTDEGRINDWPVAIPMLDMETIGAGGGSIAWIDAGHMLHVGPQSAGAKPGPACYAQGGTEPCVSDANVILGRLRPESFLGGTMHLNIDAANQAVSSLASKLGMDINTLAQGIVDIAEQEMVRALQTISMQKGYDPKEFTLCCFGGAGGLHVCSLAEKMNMSRAIIPANSGVLSAYGMLTAPSQRQFTMTHITPWPEINMEKISELFAELEQKGIDELISERNDQGNISTKLSVDLRFHGQSSTLNVPFSNNADQTFVQKHENQFGHKLSQAVELVNICVSVSVNNTTPVQRIIKNAGSTSPLSRVEVPYEANLVPIYNRDSFTSDAHIRGPAIIVEHVSTTWLASGWTLQLDKYGHMLLEKES